jgi:hypothetical protein
MEIMKMFQEKFWTFFTQTHVYVTLRLRLCGMSLWWVKTIVSINCQRIEVPSLLLISGWTRS